MSFGDLTQRQHGAAAGVDKQHVEPTMVLVNAGIQRIELLELRGVDGNTGGVANQFHRLVQFSLTATGDVDVSALFSEAFGGGQTDASASASDQCDFTFQFLAHGVSPVEIAIWCGRSVSTSREFQNRII
ncbi:hypothetical protein D9M71_554250 [compost metagenome]